ncbi:hypothetical protein [Bacillus sp. FJAT-49736]|uniref:hypothetical protein n=1 Tax=Bacillus sp. FJAT-49736 TaxID=2833582 RepID=UPI001BC93480|nr:hypothetical protein [Bacillus sp. FJAT-49736]MBS4171939.1 hypothetical protein [Bacillus sp. FJAT-49736]
MLEKLKNYLRVTWDDENEDLDQILKRGKDYLNEIAGVELDFEKDSLAIQLLLDFGRYVYNNSFELFEANFESQLLRLSLREGLKEHAENE